MTIPTLETPRLVLRPFAPDHAPQVRELAGDARVADTTLNIPHPYPDGIAEQWIATHAAAFADGTGATFAITEKDSTLCGSISMMIALRHQRAEIGYWLGVPFWGRGYTTEAALAVVHFGFTVLHLNRINAHHFARNPASGRVMQKIGMRYEGTLHQHMRKGDQFEDLLCYAILRDEWQR